jgi:ABC-type branched-subunit amino acid transport system ATPase component
MQLFDSLTVAENVAMGREAAFAGSNLLRQLAGSRRERADIADAAGAAMEQCGLGPLAGRRVGGLSTGQRRLVELARALAGRFRFLLLDEPSSGLDHRETDEFGRILTEVVDGGALGILIVEHDMRLVMEVCDHLFVLDFGILLCDGSPAEIAASPQVRAAYLGEEG